MGGGSALTRERGPGRGAQDAGKRCEQARREGREGGHSLFHFT